VYRLFLARVAVMRTASSSASGLGRPASCSKMAARSSKNSLRSSASLAMAAASNASMVSGGLAFVWPGGDGVAHDCASFAVCSWWPVPGFEFSVNLFQRLRRLFHDAAGGAVVFLPFQGVDGKRQARRPGPAGERWEGSFGSIGSRRTRDFLNFTLGVEVPPVFRKSLYQGAAVAAIRSPRNSRFL
jgi:hypothetical protein